ncbi:MAG: tripartite tricarboxylate transporter substrate binding protein [Peptococcaceae bacterium]|nr:tripartite tricarboxylate transporter substrate binding protein [Peptococcaceae bacterium]
MTFGKKMLVFVLLMLFVSASVMGCSPAPKPAASYPDKYLTGIIAWGAGGGTDSTSRLLVPEAEKILGTSIVMSNRTGATGSIATQFVHDQKADGYTLLFNAENPQLYQTLGLSALSYNDFEPVILTVNGVTVIVVEKNSPYQTLDDLVNAAKANPGKINMGISGVGGQPYMTSLILRQGEGINFNAVTFDGDGPLIAALMGKHIDVTGLAVAAAVQYVKNGDFRALAVVSNKRNPALPDVPALGELRPNMQNMLKASGFFYGVFVKKGTPEPVIAKLKEAFLAGYNSPQFQEFATNNGMMKMGITGDEAKNFMKEWQSAMAWLVHDAGNSKESPEKFGIRRP